MQNFTNDLLKAKWTEHAIELLMNSNGFFTQPMDHRIFPYDITASKSLDKPITIEVKALNWGRASYPTGVLEVYSNDSKTKRPQWIAYNDKVSVIAAINMADFKVHFFNATKLMEHFEELELQGSHMYPAHAGASSRNDCPGFTYKFAWQDKSIGHMFSADLKPFLLSSLKVYSSMATKFSSIVKALQ